MKDRVKVGTLYEGQGKGGYCSWLLSTSEVFVVLQKLLVSFCDVYLEHTVHGVVLSCAFNVSCL